MKALMITAVLLVAVSCECNAHDTTPKPIPKMDCAQIKFAAPGWMYRCENSEVVCYIYDNENMQCKFKEKR